MKNTILSVLVVIVFFSFPAKAQYFTDIKADLTHVMYAGGSWIDKDDDGDLDLIISGGYLNGDAPLESSKFYTNVNRERYFRYLQTSVANVTRGAVDAGDYDNDGDLDLVLTGKTRQGTPVTYLYRNERNNVFRRVDIAVPKLYNGDVKFVDFNRDGNQDIAICGKDANEELHTLAYAGDGKGGFGAVRIPATGVHNGELAWGDYDNDGDYDLFVTGQQSNGKGFSGLYVFNGTAFGNLNIEMPARKYSSADWGDYDNDGDFDMVLNGEGDNQSVTLRILNNMGGDQFMSINLSLPGTRTGSVDWGDYDHDGDLDLLITGETAKKQIISKVYRNDRGNNFVDIETGLVGVYLSDAGWGDYDNDGDLDLFLAGLSHDFKPKSKIYRNERIQLDKDSSINKEYDIPDAMSIWDMYNMPKERQQPYYYFMTSSCFCRPDSTYPVRGYHVFLSEAFRLEVPYYHQRSFFQNIIEKHDRWGNIKGGHPSEGYISLGEARAGREQFIRSYTDENYQIHHVPWNNHPSLER